MTWTSSRWQKPSGDGATTSAMGERTEFYPWTEIWCAYFYSILAVHLYLPLCRPDAGPDRSLSTSRASSCGTTTTLSPSSCSACKHSGTVPSLPRPLPSIANTRSARTLPSRSISLGNGAYLLLSELEEDFSDPLPLSFQAVLAFTAPGHCHTRWCRLRAYFFCFIQGS
jgi:hypothetical protein